MAKENPIFGLCNEWSCLMLLSFTVDFKFAAVPSKPADISVKNIKDDNLTLTWKPPKEDGGSKVEKYHIIMKEDDGEWKELATVKAYDNDYKVSNLKPNKKYDFAIVAENKAGLGDATETVSPTILKEKPKKAGKDIEVRLKLFDLIFI